MIEMTSIVDVDYGRSAKARKAVDLLDDQLREIEQEIDQNERSKRELENTADLLNNRLAALRETRAGVVDAIVKLRNG